VRAIRLLAEGDSLLFPNVIRELAARHADDGGDGDALRDAGLTEREGEVLRGMARGLSNAEIADELTVSLDTVKTHVSRVLTKVGARDRTQAVVRAYDSGFVRPR
jgi:DNA-binding NarL/FixJ family response regulator